VEATHELLAALLVAVVPTGSVHSRRCNKLAAWSLYNLQLLVCLDCQVDRGAELI
jgi:hypothetical protein